MDQPRKARKPRKRRGAICIYCNCPLTNLSLRGGMPEKRRTCARCEEAIASRRPSNSGYGCRDMAIREKRRENKREWARKNYQRIKERKSAAKAADPLKYAAAARTYKQRWRERLAAGQPPIREVVKSREIKQ